LRHFPGCARLAAGRYAMAHVDRGEVIHLMGRLGLSPALRAGAPLLLANGEPGQRCGWGPFFSALDARGETVVPTEAGGARIAPLSEAPPRARQASFLSLAAATLTAYRARPS
jgi:hypothetical protein